MKLEKEGPVLGDPPNPPQTKQKPTKPNNKINQPTKKEGKKSTTNTKQNQRMRLPVQRNSHFTTVEFDVFFTF